MQIGGDRLTKIPEDNPKHGKEAQRRHYSGKVKLLKVGRRKPYLIGKNKSSKLGERRDQKKKELRKSKDCEIRNKNSKNKKTKTLKKNAKLRSPRSGMCFAVDSVYQSFLHSN